MIFTQFFLTYKNYYLIYLLLLSGLCGSLLLGTGFIGSIFTGLIVEKIGHMEEIAKICFAIGSLVSVLISEFLRKSNQEIGRQQLRFPIIIRGGARSKKVGGQPGYMRYQIRMIFTKIISVWL